MAHVYCSNGLSAGAFVSYLNLFQPVLGVGAYWSALLTVALVAWHDLTVQLLPLPRQHTLRWIRWLVIGLGAVKVVLLVTFREVFPSQPGASLEIVAGHATLGALTDVGFLSFTVTSLLINFRNSIQAGQWPNFRSLWAACWLGAGSMAYGMLALFLPVAFIRLPMDVLLFGALLGLGFSVARHQALILRRSLWQEFVVSGLAVLSLSGLYWLLGWAYGLTPQSLGALTMLAIATHAAYDVVRVSLDRWLYRRESAVRGQLRQLARTLGETESFGANLQAGLENVCRVLNANGGFIAAHSAGEADFMVTASVDSLTLGESIASAEATLKEMRAPRSTFTPAITWLAPVFINQEQVAVIGLGARHNGSAYSDVDLDWLDEAALWAGRVFAAQCQHLANQARLQTLAAEAQANAVQLTQNSEELLHVLTQTPELEFTKQVEDALRHLADYAWLAESQLAERFINEHNSHIERGKAVRAGLTHAIESLKPASARPNGVLPREWHAYFILHEAYIADTPNRDIMSRLYISEGTFNRTRRKALQAVARVMAEHK